MGERRQEAQKNSQEQGTVVGGGQREELYNGQIRNKRFEDEGGARVQH